MTKKKSSLIGVALCTEAYRWTIIHGILCYTNMFPHFTAPQLETIFTGIVRMNVYTIDTRRNSNIQHIICTGYKVNIRKRLNLVNNEKWVSNAVLHKYSIIWRVIPVLQHLKKRTVFLVFQMLSCVFFWCLSFSWEILLVFADIERLWR